MQTHRSRAAVLVVLFATMTGGVFTSRAAADSLGGNWSDTSNPHTEGSGTWSYNVGGSPLSNIPSWFGEPGIKGWGPASNSAGSFLPFWSYDSGFNHISGVDSFLNDVVVHTTDTLNGVGSGEANVTWTSTVTGTANITASVWAARLSGRSNRYEFDYNGNLLGNGPIPQDGSNSSIQPIQFGAINVPLTPGDTIRLSLINTADYGDFVGVRFNIFVTVAPEPAMAGFLLPLFAMLIRIRSTRA